MRRSAAALTGILLGAISAIVLLRYGYTEVLVILATAVTLIAILMAIRQWPRG